NFVYRLNNYSTSGIEDSIRNIFISYNHYNLFKSVTNSFDNNQYLFLLPDGIFYNETDKVEELSFFGEELGKIIYSKYPDLDQVMLPKDAFSPLHVDVNIVHN